MEQEMKKPFKIVTTEYFEEIDMTAVAADRRKSRRIRVVTTETRFIDRHGREIGEEVVPIVRTTYEYL